MKKILVMALALSLVLAGCSASGGTVSEATTAPPTTIEAEAKASDAPATTQALAEPEALTEELAAVPNEDGVEISATVLERMAILPGSIFRLHVTIANNGEQAISYVKGSGSYTVPDALLVEMPDLQVIPTEDRMGMATMDMQTEALNPGDSISFDIFVLAAQSDAAFEEAARMLYEQGTYVGDMSAEELAKQFPEMKKAEAGSYEGTASFAYTTGEAQTALSGESMKSAEISFTVGIQE